MKQIRTRFAPSPTGNPHVGNMRTALFEYLFAHHHHGKFVFRLEDTDQERFVAHGEVYLREALEWLGIVPDEGVGYGGDFGPYRQSERLNIYKKHAQILLENGGAYYCFCSRERLEDLRKEQSARNEPPRYNKKCASMSRDQVQELLRRGNPYVVRLHVPVGEYITWNDLVRGNVTFNSSEIDDQILLKSDGFPTYHLANVVDDHLMEITHVIRAEEWLSSTPKHLLLYQYFGWEPPLFAHMPLVLNEKRGKLSKRDGEVALLAYRDMGYLPEALLNFLAFLGWNPKTEQELYSLQELVLDFDFDHVNKAGAIFNIKKLNWFNEQYIRKLSSNELLIRCTPYFEKAQFQEPREGYFREVVALLQDRITTLADIVVHARLFFEEVHVDHELLAWKKLSVSQAKENLTKLCSYLETYVGEWSVKALESSLLPWISEQHLKNGDVLWPFRVALSGQKSSPGPFDITAILGKERTLKRLADVLR